MSHSSIKILIFLGYLKNGDLKTHMHQSALWKDTLLMPERHLHEVSFKNKEYLGFLLSSELSYSSIHDKEQDLKAQIGYYFPKFNCEKYSIYLFPQIFIS